MDECKVRFLQYEGKLLLQGFRSLSTAARAIEIFMQKLGCGAIGCQAGNARSATR